MVHILSAPPEGRTESDQKRADKAACHIFTLNDTMAADHCDFGSDLDLVGLVIFQHTSWLDEGRSRSTPCFSVSTLQPARNPRPGMPGGALIRKEEENMAPT
jgi:hypothetical protein